MIICICKNLSEDKIDKAIDAGCETCCQVLKHYESGSACCGQCVTEITEKIREKDLTDQE